MRHEFLVADTDRDGFLSEGEIAQMILADDEGKQGLAHHERNSKSFKQRALLHARSLCMCARNLQSTTPWCLSQPVNPRRWLTVDEGKRRAARHVQHVGLAPLARRMYVM